jgi:hypothetical protein
LHVVDQAAREQVAGESVPWAAKGGLAKPQLSAVAP